MKVKSLSPVGLLATPWTAAHQAPSPMGFSRQGYWSGVPLPSPVGGARMQQSREWLSPSEAAGPQAEDKPSKVWGLARCVVLKNPPGNAGDGRFHP